MSDILIGVIVFGLVFGAAIFGMFLGRNLRVLGQKVNAFCSRSPREPNLPDFLKFAAMVLRINLDRFKTLVGYPGNENRRIPPGLGEATRVD